MFVPCAHTIDVEDAKKGRGWTQETEVEDEGRDLSVHQARSSSLCMKGVVMSWRSRGDKFKVCPV